LLRGGRDRVELDTWLEMAEPSESGGDGRASPEAAAELDALRARCAPPGDPVGA
jgi:hypothetical protein